MSSTVSERVRTALEADMISAESEREIAERENEEEAISAVVCSMVATVFASAAPSVLSETEVPQIKEEAFFAESVTVLPTERTAPLSKRMMPEEETEAQEEEPLQEDDHALQISPPKTESRTVRELPDVFSADSNPKVTWTPSKRTEDGVSESAWVR